MNRPHLRHFEEVRPSVSSSEYICISAFRFNRSKWLVLNGQLVPARRSGFFFHYDPGQSVFGPTQGSSGSIHPLFIIFIMFGHTPSATASVTMVAPGLVTPRFLLFATTSVITAAVTWHFAYVVYTHAASEQSNCQKETDNKNRKSHQYPSNRFVTNMAESLEHTCADCSNHNPVKKSKKVTGQEMI